jgi:hypothetical protein
MTTWNDIPNGDITIGQVVTDTLVQRLRDNPRAVAEGDGSVPVGEKVNVDAAKTAVVDTTKVLKPDGSGGVAWATAGGSGGDRWFARQSAEVVLAAASSLTGTAYGKVHKLTGTGYPTALPAASVPDSGKFIGFRVDPAVTGVFSLTGTINGDANGLMLLPGDWVDIYTDGIAFFTAARGSLASMAQIGPWNDAGSITITATTTNPTKGTVVRDKVWWRRVGDSAEIRYEFEQSTLGTAGVGTYKLTLPAGLSVDLTKVASQAATTSPPFNIRGQVGTMWVSKLTAGDYYGCLGAVAVASATELIGINLMANNTLLTCDPEYWGNGAVGMNQLSTFSFTVVVPIAGWDTGVTTVQNRSFRLAETYAMTRVTVTPAALGEYRSYRKDAGAQSGTNGAPLAAPSAANGFRLSATAFASAAGDATRYEMFVGRNKVVQPQWYAQAGRTGFACVDIINIPSANVVDGSNWGYDPSTGLAWTSSQEQQGSTTTRGAATEVTANGGSPNRLTEVFFDFVVSDTPQAVESSGAATAAEIAAETVVDKFIRPDRLKNAPGVAKAWVNFNGTTGAGAAIRDSYNVSSVTEVGSGAYRINFATPMANTNYSVGGMSTLKVPYYVHPQINSLADMLTTSVLIVTSNDNVVGQIDTPVVCVQIFGDQ